MKKELDKTRKLLVDKGYKVPEVVLPSIDNIIDVNILK